MLAGSLGIALAERGLLPESSLRRGIRGILRARLREQSSLPPEAREDWIAEMGRGPIAILPAVANKQHYEVPAAVFERVLGPHLKYSSGYWHPGVTALEEAERAMLDLTMERAALRDGQHIVELGCGWGSLTLHMARRFPRARILAVSNSHRQREFILGRALSDGCRNISVITADMNVFEPPALADRIVSVEMFEHMRNWGELLRRIGTWLRPDGALFLHVFAHRQFAYPYEVEGDDDWMARHFFTGGMMPSVDLLPRVATTLAVEEQWVVPGTHYAKTAEAWHRNLVAHREAVRALLAADLGEVAARRAYHRWRLFYLACAELFGFHGGDEWLVAHYRLRPSHPARA